MTGHTVKKILLVDDDADDLVILQDALAMITAEVTVDFAGPELTIDAVDSGIYDIVFLDINMHYKTGFDLLGEIRASGNNIPVVMYSTTNNELYVRKAYELGATLYFPKPDSVSALTRCLETLLRMNWTEPAAISSSYVSDEGYKVLE